ncbi:hypothetical protein CJF30_00005026 [Rutstroemia sp. NJR-2017a BBW]|nr:hypothetical protein CJF30_00005026 [Rutstroemia sp. NJR-2017a BBW]
MLYVFIFIEYKQKDRAMIPFRIAKQRTVAASSAFTVFVNMAIDTHIYHLPIYFQAVHGTTAEKSGIHLLPYLDSNIIATVASGSCVSYFGYYVPFMWLGGILLTVGSGLLHTLGRYSTTAQWAGYEVLTGIGFGIGFQIPYSAVHVVLPKEDVAIGTLGGALAVSIAQNILTNSLIQNLKSIPGLNSTEIVALGAANLRNAVPPGHLDVVLDAYSDALSKTLVLPIAAAGLAFISSLGMEWRKIEEKPET